MLKVTTIFKTSQECWQIHVKHYSQDSKLISEMLA